MASLHQTSSEEFPGLTPVRCYLGHYKDTKQDLIKTKNLFLKPDLYHLL